MSVDLIDYLFVQMKFDSYVDDKNEDIGKHLPSFTIQKHPEHNSPFLRDISSWYSKNWKVNNCVLYKACKLCTFNSVWRKSSVISSLSRVANQEKATYISYISFFE